MVIDKKKNQKVEEQQWENPLNPEKPADERDREQLERQYREAKRRSDNLSENQEKSKQKTNII
jgi:hypothetical protein